MFCWLRFHFVVDQILWPFCSNFQKQTLPKIASKKGDPLLESKWLWCRPGAPRDAASRARWFNSNQFNSRSIQFNSIQFKASSNWKWLFELARKLKNCSEMAARVGFDCKTFKNNSKQSVQFNSNRARIGHGCLSWPGNRTNPRNGCLSWLRLQKFQKQFEKLERAHYWWSDTLLGRGPANSRMANQWFRTDCNIF